MGLVGGSAGDEEGRDGHTLGVVDQQSAHGFGVDVDSLDAGHKVPAVALEEERVFAPEVVFVRGVEGFLQSCVVGTFGVKDQAGGSVSACMPQEEGEGGERTFRP